MDRPGMKMVSEGVTLLMYACQQCQDSDARHILQKKPQSIMDRDRTRKTALHYCAENPNLRCAELLLNTEPSLVDLVDEEGYTCLHLAVISGNKALTRFLISRKADVNCLDSEKHSVIHWATLCGELECLHMVSDAGANPSTADIHGAFPLHYAAQMCGPNSELGTDPSIGLAALRKLLALNLKSTVDVNVADQDGRQPLLWAASAGSSDAILTLVNAGANVAAQDKEGLSALHCAASRGHNECSETLITLCGVEVDSMDNNGCTALFYAVTLGNADCTEVLLKYDADPNRQDRKGRTPAHCGAAKGQLETLKILYKHGANLWLRNYRGNLPLHEAIQSGRKDLVKWLLELRPEMVNAANSDSRTSLHIAAINNNVEMCKVLIDNGANINAIMKNSKGKPMTPVDAALYRGNEGCAKYLQLHGGVTAAKVFDDKNYVGNSNGSPRAAESSPDRESLTNSDNLAQFMVGDSPPQERKNQYRLPQQHSMDRTTGVTRAQVHRDMETKKSIDRTPPYHSLEGTDPPSKHTSVNNSPVSGETSLTTHKDSGFSDNHVHSGRESDVDTDSPSAPSGDTAVINSVTTVAPKRRRRVRGGPSGGHVAVKDVPESESEVDKPSTNTVVTKEIRSLRNPAAIRNGNQTATVTRPQTNREMTLKSGLPGHKNNDAYTITNSVQNSMRRYQRERRIFQVLLEMKRLQIRCSRANESVLVKRLVDKYISEGLTVGPDKYNGPYTFRSFEKYLYEQLRILSTKNGSSIDFKTDASHTLETLDPFSRNNESNLNDVKDDPMKCSYSTFRCHHAAHALSGVPCAAFIRAGKSRGCESFLPQIFSVPTAKSASSASHLAAHRTKDKDPVSLDLKQGSKEKKSYTVPTESMDKSKRYQVTFTIGLSTPKTAKPNIKPSIQNNAIRPLKPRNISKLVKSV